MSSVSFNQDLSGSYSLKWNSVSRVATTEDFQGTPQDYTSKKNIKKVRNAMPLNSWLKLSLKEKLHPDPEAIIEKG